MTEATRLISLPRPSSFLAIRDEYLAITGGDSCAAALLGVFEALTLWRRGHARPHPDWVSVSIPRLVERLRGLWSRSTVQARLDWLRGVGFLARRGHRHLAYRFNADAVQAALDVCLNADAAESMDSTAGEGADIAACEPPVRQTEWQSHSADTLPGDPPVAGGTRRQAAHPPTGGDTRRQAVIPADSRRYASKNRRYASKFRRSYLLESPKDTPLEPGEETTPPEPPALAREAAGGGVGDQDLDRWGLCLSQLELQFDPGSFHALRGARLLRVEGDPRGAVDPTTPQPPASPGLAAPPRVYVVGVRSAWAVDACAGRLYRAIRRVLADCGGVGVELRFEALPPEPVEAPPPPVPEPVETPPPMTARALYEQMIAPVRAEDEAALAQVALYPLSAVRTALKTAAVNHAKGRLRDPAGYLLGILRRLCPDVDRPAVMSVGGGA